MDHADIDHSGLTGTGIPATTVDAKGDLIAGTADNTVDNLTVGANDTILMADSSQTMGLKWVASATPSTQAFGDSAAVGTADTFTRGDHKHAMPTAAITTSGLTQATARLLGRTTASTGAVEEITVGSGLTLSAGSLTAAGGGGSVPGWISKFAGTTDATHFYWDGNDLAGFTEQKPSGNSTWVESLNLVSVLMDSQATDPDAVAQLIAQTISTGDSWEVAVNVSALMSDSGGDTTGNRAFGIVMTDGTATTSNVVAGHIQVANDATTVLLVGRHGTLTSVATAPWVSVDQGDVLGNWIWIKLKYSAANTFQLYFSSSMAAQYSVFEEADISKTMTPTHVGIFGWNHAAGPAMFTFGPLLKV